MVQIRVEKAKINQKRTSLLVVGIFENEQGFSELNELDPFIAFTIKEIFDNKEFNGSFGSTITLYTMGKGPMKKIMLIGLGNREKFTNETVRIIAGKAALKAKERASVEFSILPFSHLQDGSIEALCEGICLSLYSFTRYKTKNNEQSLNVNEVTILVNAEPAMFQSIVDKTNLIVEAVNFARDLCNLPPNECTPAHLASAALSLANEYSMKVRIIERYEMESMGLAAIVAVGMGSNSPPKMIILE